MKNLGPHLKVLEFRLGESSDNSVGDVANTRLERQKGGRKATGRNLVLEELDQVASNLLRVFAFSGVVAGVVGSVRLYDRDDACGVDRNRDGADAVRRLGDEVRLAMRGEERLVDVV